MSGFKGLVRVAYVLSLFKFIFCILVAKELYFTTSWGISGVILLMDRLLGVDFTRYLLDTRAGGSF